jgi:lipoyl(octanoyl) transferase
MTSELPHLQIGEVKIAYLSPTGIMKPTMSLQPRNRTGNPRALSAYLLGRIDFAAWLELQRQLVFEVSGGRSAAILVLCDHANSISVGREGSAAHILFEPEELQTRGWPVRWVNRGGGCLLHVPGQISAYPIVALDEFGINLHEYVQILHTTIRGVLQGLEVASDLLPSKSGVWVGDRRIAHVGVAVRDWVAYHGFTLNVAPNLKPFRFVKCDGADRPMTSIERERRTHVRAALVRQRLVNAFAEQFAFDRVSIFHNHPSLNAKASTHAVVTSIG